MATIDGSKGLQAASGESFDYVCGPCEDEGHVKEAKQYCGICSVFLCDTCERHHRKLPISKNHKVEPAYTVSVSARRLLSLYCGCKNNREPEYYCENHNDVICTPCKDANHHKCRTTQIQQKSSGYKSSQIDVILFKSKSLKDKYNKLIQECSANKKELARSKDVCQNEIKTFRKEINDFLDRLEQKMVKELNDCEDEKRQQIDEQIAILTNALQMLDTDHTILAKAKADGRNQIMFTAEVRASKNIRDFKRRLAELEKDITNMTLSFEKNKKLADLQSDIKSFGVINTKYHKDEPSEKIVLLEKHVQSRRQVNVRLGDDASSPGITCCAVMPNGSIVICDHSNGRLKLFDNTLGYQESVSISGIDNASVVDPNTVIVTVPVKKELQYVLILTQLQLGRTIKLDSQCWGICVSGDDIYVTCDTLNGWEIRVIGLEGTDKLRMPVERYSRPYEITLSPSGEKIFFIDDRTHIVTCMTVEGTCRIVYRYEKDNMKSTRGIYCDSEDNLFVCDRDSNSVHAITADGNHGRTLLTYSDGLYSPRCIAYRRSDNEVIIGSEIRDYLLVYKLKN